MNKQSFSANKKLLLILIPVFILGFWILSSNNLMQPKKESQTSTPAPANPNPEQGEPTIVSTNPNPLEGTIILPTQTIEVTFNHPLAYDPGRIVLEPKIEYKVEIAEDDKTLKIIPVKPFLLGQEYRLTIQDGYPFDSGEKLNQGVTYSFKTIDYRGI